MQGSRPARIGEEIRQELADLLSREVRDPGIGFVTVTHVKVSADLQVARAYYTTLGDEAARRTTAKALERAKPFLRQRIAARVGLRRAPELAFQYDESIAREERIESLLQEIRESPGRRTPRSISRAPPRRSRPTRSRPAKAGPILRLAMSSAAVAMDILVQIRDAIRARSSFLLTSHARPDGDSIGSQVALAAALRAIGKSVRMVNRDRPPSAFLALPGVAGIEVAPSVEGDFDALVVLECSDVSRPGVAGLEGYYTINIDHHPGNAMYGAINWFDGNAAACGEQVAAVIDALGVPWTPEIGSAVYLAILTDTGGFRHSHITNRTFEWCRRATEAGVDAAALARLVYEQSSIGKLKLIGALLDGDGSDGRRQARRPRLRRRAARPHRRDGGGHRRADQHAADVGRHPGGRSWCAASRTATSASACGPRAPPTSAWSRPSSAAAATPTRRASPAATTRRWSAATSSTA